MSLLECVNRVRKHHYHSLIWSRLLFLSEMYKKALNLVSAVKILKIFWFWCQEGQTCLRSGCQYSRHVLL